MTVAKIKAEEVPAVDPVEQWRRDELARAGYPDVYADLLASLSDVDLHLAIDLIDRGCPWELAVDILY